MAVRLDSSDYDTTPGSVPMYLDWLYPGLDYECKEGY